MDLQELQARTKIDLRKLRYCLDHGLIPELHFESTADKVGRPRRFSEAAGLAIVCADELRKVGLPHEKIRRFLKGLLSITLPGKGPPKPALAAVLEGRGPAFAQLGDGVHVRIAVKEGEDDSPWFPPTGQGPPAKGYRPLVSVTVDLRRICDEFFHRR